MNRSVRRIIRALARNNMSWRLLDLGYRFFARFRLERDLLDQPGLTESEKKIRDELHRRFADLTVKNGPFKGLRYPAFIAHNSALIPKLLGSYECELWSTFEELLKLRYKKVLDIGCAEGYYAVGIARLQPDAEVHAFDLDASALDECERMARFNNTANVRFIHRCLPRDLLSLDLSGQNLVISDCEGYELDLFNEEVVHHMRYCHLVIELHDYRNERILPHIERVFAGTHTLRLVPSLNTIKKLKAFGLDEGLNEEVMARFFSERNSRSEWAVLYPLPSA